MTEAFVAKVPSEPFVSAESAFDITYSPSGENACPHKLSSRSAVLTKNFLSFSSFSSFSSLARFCALGRSAFAKASATESSMPGLSETSSTASEALKYHFPVCTFLSGPRSLAIERQPSDSRQLPERLSVLRPEGKHRSPLSFETGRSAPTSAPAPFGPIPQPDRSSVVSVVLKIVVNCRVREPFAQGLG